jgi:TolB protein
MSESARECADFVTIYAPAPRRTRIVPQDEPFPFLRTTGVALGLRYQSCRHPLLGGARMSARLAAVAAIAGVLAAAAGTAVSSSTAAAPSLDRAARPPAGSIVYARYVSRRAGETSEIFVDARGETRRLTRNDVNDWSPSWSPDRRWIVFVRTTRLGESDIWVMRHDGSGARRLAGSAKGALDRDPAWSPDGRLIAFASTRAYPGGEGGLELYVMRANGTGVRRLTRTSRWQDDLHPRFSPDGRHLVFASDFGFSELFRIRVADGGGLRQLTSWMSPTPSEGHDLAPDWSPDGRRIAFVSNRNGRWEVMTIGANGGDRHVVTSGSGAFRPHAPRWAPAGRRLLFAALNEQGGGPGLRAVNEDGTVPAELGSGFDADW